MGWSLLLFIPYPLAFSSPRFSLYWPCVLVHFHQASVSRAILTPMSFLKTPLVGLRADHFRHPLDLQATANLKQLFGLDVVIRNLLGPLAEQVFYLDNIASSVLVSEQQLPDLHKLLLEACKILDLEPPQLYVRQHPVPNAYTFAMRGKQPFIVIHTSLIDLLTPEETQAVIAHELGHLKCDHGVYLTLANILIQAAGGWAQCWLKICKCS